MKVYDTIIVGGGFYGLRIAQYLSEELGIKDIIILEKEESVMTRASYNNQARVHGGYHYPRNVLTALRSKVNLPVFYNEFKDAVEDGFINYYAVARNISNVTAKQYETLFNKLDAKLIPSNNGVENFNANMVERVYEVEEYVFNSSILRKILLDKLSQLGLKIKTSEEVLNIKEYEGNINLKTSKGKYISKRVINTTYASINQINKNSGLPIIPLKHELAEICLVDIPNELSNKSFTVMCGPFFSLMPFPEKNKYSLSHVRYTPHKEWNSLQENRIDFKSTDKINTNFYKMIADVKRFMPSGNKIKYSGESIWEIKTMLPENDRDDGRPILFVNNHGNLKNYICIMGGKIDNIYDVFKDLRKVYAR